MARRGKHHKLYGVWAQMLRRCDNPRQASYKYYGARGIGAWPEWRSSFAAFAAYIAANLGPCPLGMSLDRIDNNGNYEPGNVRWATHKEQRANQRPRNAIEQTFFT